MSNQDDLATSRSRSPTRSRASCVAVREVAKGDDPDSAVSFLLLEVSQLLLAGGRLGANEDVVPDERYEPDAGPEPDVDGCATRWPSCWSRSTSTPRSSTRTRAAGDLHLADLRRPGRRDEPTCGTACPTTGPAVRRRRCGGGSSRTCPTGARPRPRRCAPCSRWSRTSGWTARWTPPTRSRTGCSPRPSPRRTPPPPSTPDACARRRARTPVRGRRTMPEAVRRSRSVD